MLPFPRFYPAGVALPNLIDRLTTQGELQGLLRASVDGLRSVMRRGAFALPPSVVSATDKFKRDADPMRGFIDERIEFRHPHNAPFVNRTDIYAAYSTWATLNGFHTMSAQRFYESFVMACTGNEFELRSVTHHGARGFIGIVLR